MNIKLFFCVVMLVGLSAIPLVVTEAQGYDSSTPDPRQSLFPDYTHFFNELFRNIRDRSHDQIYATMSSELRGILGKDVFIGGIDPQCEVLGYEILGVEDYGSIKAVVMRYDEKYEKSDRARSLSIVYLKEGGHGYELYNFPFVNAGVPASVLHTPPIFREE